MIGPSLRGRVDPVPLPGETATAGEVWTALDGQTARLDTSNDYKQAVIETVEACERRDREAVAEITRPWWKVWG